MGGVRANLRKAIVFALALGVITGAPNAGAEWKSPQVLNRPATDANGPHVVTTNLGEVVSVWVEQDEGDPFPMRMVSRVRRADGTLEAPVELAPELAGCVLDLATDALGNVIASWQLPDGTIKVSRRPPGGSFGPPEVVARPTNGGSSPVLATNARGDAALMWAQFRPQARWGQWTHFVAVSRLGAPFGAPEQIEPWRPVATGGYNVALTPAGDVVGIWAANPEKWEPERDTYGDPARVETATLTAAGLVTPVQKLSEFEGGATCPELLSDGQGRVAALWHEIHTDYCLVWGRDMLALRKAGILFEPPTEVPTSRGNVSRGELAVSDAGEITVAFADSDGGEVVRGSFDSPLEVAVPQFPSSGGASLAGNAGGEVVFGSPEGSGLQTARLNPEGRMEAPQDLRDDCAWVNYADFDVNSGGLAAATMMVQGGNLELSTDGPSDAPGSQDCSPPSLWYGPGSGPSAHTTGPPPSASGAPGSPPSAVGFSLNVRRARIARKGSKLRLKADVACGVACSTRVVGKLIGRGGKLLDRASRVRSLARGSGRIVLDFGMPGKLSRVRRPRRVSLRVTATDRAGNVLVRKLSVAP
jgi:hypothetical protein